MRTIAYVDGFNLYYGACRAPGRKWLDLTALATRLLPNDDVFEICYFTANFKVDPANPGRQDRQRLYQLALRSSGLVEIYLGRFLRKRVTGVLVDHASGEPPIRTVKTFEEKGTDVNLASRPLKDAFEGRMEQAAVISNDGDLKMPIKIVREHLGLPVTVINPVLHARHRSAALSPDPLPGFAHFIRLTASDAELSQFPKTVISPKGTRITKPPNW